MVISLLVLLVLLVLMVVIFKFDGVWIFVDVKELVLDVYEGCLLVIVGEEKIVVFLSR